MHEIRKAQTLDSVESPTLPLLVMEGGGNSASELCCSVKTKLRVKGQCPPMVAHVIIGWRLPWVSCVLRKHQVQVARL